MGRRTPHYIGLIHKERDSCFGVSFPDVPGVIAAGGTIDEAMAEAAEALSFAAEDWEQLTGVPFPPPRTIDQLRRDAAVLEHMQDAIVAAIPLALPFRSAAE